VNRFLSESETDPPVLQIDPNLERNQIQSLQERRAARDEEAVTSALAGVTAAAGGTDNLLYPMKEALVLGATIGEVTKALLPVFGKYRASS